MLPSTRDCKEKLTFNKDTKNEVKYEELVSLLLGSLKCTTKSGSKMSLKCVVLSGKVPVEK